MLPRCPRRSRLFHARRRPRLRLRPNPPSKQSDPLPLGARAASPLFLRCGLAARVPGSAVRAHPAGVVLALAHIAPGMHLQVSMGSPEKAEMIRGLGMPTAFANAEAGAGSGDYGHMHPQAVMAPQSQGESLVYMASLPHAAQKHWSGRMRLLSAIKSWRRSRRAGWGRTRIWRARSCRPLIHSVALPHCTQSPACGPYAGGVVFQRS